MDILLKIDQVPLEFKRPMNQISQINRRAGDRVELDCTFNGRPTPKILWLKGKSLLDMSQSTFLLENNNARYHIFLSLSSFLQGFSL